MSWNIFSFRPSKANTYSPHYRSKKNINTTTLQILMSPLKIIRLTFSWQFLYFRGKSFEFRHSHSERMR